MMADGLMGLASELWSGVSFFQRHRTDNKWETRVEHKRSSCWKNTSQLVFQNQQLNSRFFLEVMGRLFVSSNDNNKESFTKPPLLFLLRELNGENKHGFLDIEQGTVETVKIEELDFETDCLASAHGWLLMRSKPTESLFFFNPLKKSRIDLPRRSSMITAASFSAPPTSLDCRVFIVGNYKVDTLLVNYEKVWTRFPCTFYYKISMFTSCCNDFFYCVDYDGGVMEFNVKFSSWKSFKKESKLRLRISSVFGFNGKIYACKKERSVVKVYRLELQGEFVAWEEVEVNEMGSDVSIFFSPYGCCAVSGLNAGLQKKIVVAMDDPTSRCLIGDGRQFNTPNFGWIYTPIWIERAC
ncbi:F-box/kelch-repeat protein At3g18720-like [Tripterygium wilfordii]|uniref:F-box/kelch-repeat protein At3g18720-like n=1 Tax=Tripterygium wilfordii TaxID=458696 RepID=UPI0018F816C2|nr:F-box/kelch-repeat protein At3g18720-like [Tripterygium wilfordii]